MTAIPNEVLELSDQLARDGGPADEALRAKCRHEHLGRCAVIMEWGDPRKWRSVCAALADSEGR